MATKKKPEPRILSEVIRKDPLFYINRSGFGKYREDLIECGFNPDDPKEASMCEAMIHTWKKD